MYFWKPASPKPYKLENVGITSYIYSNIIPTGTTIHIFRKGGDVIFNSSMTKITFGTKHLCF